MITLDSTRDLLYLVLAIGVIWIAAMLTWLLFEVALLLRNANRFVGDVRRKVSRIEDALTSMRGKLESSAGYLGILAKGGKSLAKYLEHRRSDWMDEDEEEDETPRRRRSSRRR
ncbi:hypothetical protein KJZ71_04615 [Patescibacteria group bacterium]|jgi:biopolymer transport protein ExbB/TolQ|uniref:DUF948 domain-containing protein n=1 Tax=candidate division WWE3 bacterium TaxID=2053526 RepID=A0A928TPV2_UNCKA|nr:hypothetical protein [candidate division WWE3 bacterium]MCL4733053.1 hypothetical protein [Patescibacteria group bacterium]MDL1953338.1 hypothetical protein [Candidatus Uhrbacteria bacterium UHB]RIL00567.1 MAG: hypothetical protein DCC77_03355 [Candidatus Uhrbacteria bacterium]